jgi:hypothetical protein
MDVREHVTAVKYHCCEGRTEAVNKKIENSNRSAGCNCRLCTAFVDNSEKERNRVFVTAIHIFQQLITEL